MTKRLLDQMAAMIPAHVTYPEGAKPYTVVIQMDSLDDDGEYDDVIAGLMAIHVYAPDTRSAILIANRQVHISVMSLGLLRGPENAEIRALCAFPGHVETCWPAGQTEGEAEIDATLALYDRAADPYFTN